MESELRCQACGSSRPARAPSGPQPASGDSRPSRACRRSGAHPSAAAPAGLLEQARARPLAHEPAVRRNGAQRRRPDRGQRDAGIARWRRPRRGGATRRARDGDIHLAPRREAQVVGGRARRARRQQDRDAAARRLAARSCPGPEKRSSSGSSRRAAGARNHGSRLMADRAPARRRPTAPHCRCCRRGWRGSAPARRRSSARIAAIGGIVRQRSVVPCDARRIRRGADRDAAVGQRANGGQLSDALQVDDAIGVAAPFAQLRDADRCRRPARAPRPDATRRWHPRSTAEPHR